LWLHNRLVRVRSIFRPYGVPRWQHVVEADDVETQERVSLVTGVPVVQAERPSTPTARYWLKHQGGEVWVVYAHRHGQLMRYQGGSFRLLDVRPAPQVPVVPRGGVEVAGAFAPVMQELLGMSNDQRYLAGEEMGEEFHERHESYCREINEMAAKSFWYQKLGSEL
jgi:hypothetical protein